jgi:hypothetical protein
MASRVYDELYAEYGRLPTEEEVLLRLQRRVGRDRASASTEARNPESEQDPRTGAKDASPVPGARRQAWRVEKPRERGLRGRGDRGEAG